MKEEYETGNIIYSDRIIRTRFGAGEGIVNMLSLVPISLNRGDEISISVRKSVPQDIFTLNIGSTISIVEL